MVLHTVYVVRHGYRSNWLPENEQLPIPTGIKRDPPLAPHGLEQAKELAEFVNKQSPKPQLVFSSPFYRCLQTAEPTAKLLNVPFIMDRGLGEYFHPNEAVTAASLEELKGFFPILHNEMETNTVVPSLEGETETQLFQRCVEFWKLFLQRMETEYPDIECVMLATHAATKIALSKVITGHSSVRDGEKFGAATCSFDKFHRNKDGKSWTIDINGETSFLSKGAERVWEFSEEEDYVDVLVNLVMPENEGDDNELQKRIAYRREGGVNGNQLKIQGLGEKEVLATSNDGTMVGQWQKLVGSELVFDEHGQCVGVVDGHIVMESGHFVEKEWDGRSLRARALELANKLEGNEKKVDVNEDVNLEKEVQESEPSV